MVREKALFSCFERNPKVREKTYMLPPDWPTRSIFSGSVIARSTETGNVLSSKYQSAHFSSN